MYRVVLNEVKKAFLTEIHWAQDMNILLYTSIAAIVHKTNGFAEQAGRAKPKYRQYTLPVKTYISSKQTNTTYEFVRNSWKR